MSEFPKGVDFLEELLIVLQEKIVECWSYREVDHYANECKNRKGDKLIATLESLEYLSLVKKKH